MPWKVASSVVSLFVRLWVEMTSRKRSLRTTRVSLFVRLWVEILSISKTLVPGATSASSWGCELKLQHRMPCFGNGGQPLREAVSWNTHRMNSYWEGEFVSLFVRLWVEITTQLHKILTMPSASSWGCELKYICTSKSNYIYCQPLREAVSWNNMGFNDLKLSSRQPLREAVSWNTSDPPL